VQLVVRAPVLATAVQVALVGIASRISGAHAVDAVRVRPLEAILGSILESGEHGRADPAEELAEYGSANEVCDYRRP
jgi:hypothetical protein